jgi:hypothetical protein
MEQTKTFDQMTISEVEQALKEAYAELLHGEEDNDAFTFHQDATAALVKLRNAFRVLQDMEKQQEQEALVGDARPAQR